MTSIKIAYTSDLHYPITKDVVISKFAQHLKDIEPDILIFGGDIAEGSYNLAECLSFFKDIRCTKLAVAGNHDLWFINDIASNVAWSRFSQICSDNDVTCIEDNNFIIGDLAIVGSYLHYDYSAKDPIGSLHYMSDEWYKDNKAFYNNDARFIKGLPDDIELANDIGQKFISRLRAAQENDNIAQIVVISHVPCLSSQIVRKPEQAAWSIGNAYFGILTHEPEILNTQKISHVISGHSHQYVNTEINGHDNLSTRKIKVFVNPSDYGSPQVTIINVDIQE